MQHRNKPSTNAPANIPLEVAEALQAAFNFYNIELFSGALPSCNIILHRSAKAYGYFWADRWTWKHDPDYRAHEIALNPDHLGARPLLEGLATLVHEMCHLQQQEQGSPSRTGYHNREWADMMDAVGLVPSDTAAPGGKRTGQAVSHYIKDRGRFALATERLLLQGFELNWSSEPPPGASAKGGASGSRAKYTCPECAVNVWGKAGLAIGCGDCETRMETN